MWCAAAAGHLNVVRTLINKHNAYVNSTTRTKSTPLRAACYDGHLDIVKFLIENGADIEIANRHGHTCLMIACYKSHINIARYLIECGADVNRKSVKGNTALHDCADSGSLEIMQLLLNHRAKMEADAFGVTPLLAAALAGHPLIVSLLVDTTECTKEEKIDAYDLLGATYVDKKRDMMGALEFWKLSLQEKQAIACFKSKPTSPSCPYRTSEIRTLEQLEEIFSDPDDMRMQALYVRERILGPAHPDTSYYIRYRGAVYADTGNFDKCINLWMYALDMQQSVMDKSNPMIQSSLYSFAELFSFIMSKSAETVKFCDLFAVFERARCQLHYSKTACVTMASVIETDHLNRALVIVLHFAALLCRLEPHLSEEDRFTFKKALYDFIKDDFRGRENATPLHLACMTDATCPSIRFPLCSFPMHELISLLLELGSSPNATDSNGNTPLHLIARFRPLSNSIVHLLLQYGAHIDARNNDGLTPLSLLMMDATLRHANRLKKLEIAPLKFMNLQCLCAQVIRRHHVPVTHYLPPELANFVAKH